MSGFNPARPWERSFRNFNNDNHFSRDESRSGLRDSINFPTAHNLGAINNNGVTSPPLPPRPSRQQGSSIVNSGMGSTYSPSYLYNPYRNYAYGYSPYSSGPGPGPGPSYTDGSWFGQIAEDGSRQAFQSIESVVRAVSSVSMMLESTYQAVFSSFQAVLSVADHMSRLKSHMTQVISALAVIKGLSNLLKKFLQLLHMTDVSVDDQKAWSRACSEAESNTDLTEEDLKRGRYSWQLPVFFAVVFGGPWLIWKIICSFMKQDVRSKKWACGEGDHYIGVVHHDFTAENETELTVKRGQNVYLAPKELQPRVRGWLLASIDGKRTGLIPANYIKISQRKNDEVLTKPDRSKCGNSDFSTADTSD